MKPTPIRRAQPVTQDGPIRAMFDRARREVRLREDASLSVYRWLYRPDQEPRLWLRIVHHVLCWGGWAACGVLLAWRG